MKKKLNVCNERFHGISLSPEFFHRKSMESTEKLRKIMKQYPSLPVVLLLPTGVYADNLECNVAYVHDSVSGEFREKIIVIHNGENESQRLEDYETVLPF